MFICLLFLTIAMYLIFAGILIFLGHREFKDKEELRQGIIAFTIGVVISVACCVWIDNQFKDLTPNPNPEYPTVLEPLDINDP